MPAPTAPHQPRPAPTEHVELLGLPQTTLGLIALGALLAGCLIIGWVQRRHVAAVARLIWRDYRSVLWCFVALWAFAAAAGFYVDGATAKTTDFWNGAIASIFASLVENLIFFALLGFGLLVVQRRETDRNRSLDDKIDLLFNAKTLRSGEVSFLRDELRKISADCQMLEVEIDVLSHDDVDHLVQIDVSRTWLVANYLADESAIYSWRLKVSADEAGGYTPSMTVFPSFSTTLTKAADGSWRKGSDDEMLHPGGDLAGGSLLTSDQHPLTICPQEAREFRTRFTGWQRLHSTSGGAPNPGTIGPPRPDPDSYKFTVSKHWDEVRVTIRNSLKKPLQIAISHSVGTSERRQVRSLELAAGEKQRRAHVFENLPANSRVYVSFDPR